MNRTCSSFQLRALSFSFLLLAVPFARSGVALADDTIGPSRKTSSPATMTGVDIGVASGVAQFPDMQVPFDLYRGSRVDGSPGKQASSNHIGIPVAARIGWRSLGPGLGFRLGFEAMHVSGKTGPEESLGASYGRLHLATGLTWTWTEAPFHPSLGVGLGARRDAFMNVSSGHTVQSYMAEYEARALLTRKVSLKAQFAHSLGATLGYNSGQQFSSKPLPHSATSVMSLGAQLGYYLNRRSAVQLGYEISKINASISDIYAYQSVGLALRAPDVPSQTFNLTTHVLTLGLAKAF